MCKKDSREKQSGIIAEICIKELSCQDYTNTFLTQNKTDSEASYYSYYGTPVFQTSTENSNFVASFTFQALETCATRHHNQGLLKIVMAVFGLLLELSNA